MSAMQKHAWFNLIVIAATVVVVLSLYPRFGPRAAGSWGLLGLCGLGVLFYRRRGSRVATDERDELINRRSMIWAYSVLWLAFVAAAVSAQLVFGNEVPVTVVQNSVWAAFMILIGVQSIATLVQYRRATADAH